MNKSDIKIIFTDVDWTILNHGHRFHSFDLTSIRALKKAQRKGVLVYLATARPYESLKETGIYDLFTPDGIVCTNGAVAFVNNKIVRNDAFKPEVVENVLKVCDKYSICVQLATEKSRYFSSNKNRFVDGYFQSYYEHIAPIKKDFSKENVTAILIFAPREYDEVFKKEFPKRLMIDRFTEFGIDLHFHHVDKSQGVKDVLKKLKISPENALCIGDDNGDIDMFKFVKYSACVGNGKEEAKIAASYVSEDIDHHGVKQILKHFDVI